MGFRLRTDVADGVGISSDSRAAAVAIVRHYLANPTARDAVAGIEQWWLEGQYTHAAVEDGLGMLIQMGWIETSEVAPRQWVYGFLQPDDDRLSQLLHHAEDFPWPT